MIWEVGGGESGSGTSELFHLFFIRTYIKTNNHSIFKLTDRGSFYILL